MAQRKRTDLIVFHCSATRPNQDVGRAKIEEWHLAKGWAAIGYHFVIRRSGALELGRPLEDIGAHVQGNNATSVGICMAGGLDDTGKEFENNPAYFTQEQWDTARLLVAFLRKVYPTARVCGHRDLSPDLNADGKIERREWLKTCPGFDAAMSFPV